MNLPFTLDFFKEIEIYKQLTDLNRESSVKPIHNCCFVVLHWGYSKHHQHLGSFISTGNITDYLTENLGNEKYLNKKPHPHLVHQPQQILDTLVVLGYADEHKDNTSVRINRKGLIAGKVLTKTNYLRSEKNKLVRYNSWVIVWWITLFAGFIILIRQALEGFNIPKFF